MKTAVEWFSDRIKHGGLVGKKQFDELLEQANKMFEEQIMQAFANGKINGDKNWAHRYYNKTFKSE